MILVTGATGFIGAKLCDRLTSGGRKVIQVARKNVSPELGLIIDDIQTFQDWDNVLRGVDTIVHLAGRAHILNDRSDNPLEHFRRVNTRATVALARHAANASVKRFIFISSIGVNGNETYDKPFSVDDVPQPNSAYAISKYEAELALNALSKSTDLEVVVIRPPLVYGPNAPGNFRNMLRWLSSNVPLPFGSVTNNRRSFVGIDNLVDLIGVCIDHRLAANQTFLVSDGEDLSTTDLLHRLSRALRKEPVLLPIPPSLLRVCAKVIGKGETAQRLLGDLRVDIQHTCDTLEWSPPLSVDEGLTKAVTGFNPH